MKKSLTEVICIIDASGSMNHLASDTVGGFNSFIEKQKQEEGETKVTLVTFDSSVQTIHDQVDVKDVPELTIGDYMMGGMTALLDAIGSTLVSVGNRLAKTPEEERPSKVIVMITTDGEENSSHEFTRGDIKKMIEEQTNKYAWQFMFAGANIDAVKEASSLGISEAFAKNYSYGAKGVASVYGTLANVTALSSRGASLDDLSNCFSNGIE